MSWRSTVTALSFPERIMDAVLGMGMSFFEGY
jgi:hypothetical protein